MHANRSRGAIVSPTRTPFTVTVSLDEIDHLDHVRRELDHASLLLDYAIDRSGPDNVEYRAMLLDDAVDVLAPIREELANITRALATRLRAVRAKKR